MRTDTTERGLERLMCTALVGHPVRSAGRGRRRGSACGPRQGRVERRQLSRLRPGVLCRLGTARGVPTGYAAGGRRRVDVVQGRSDAARVPDSAAGGRLPSAVPSTCCATGSNIGRCTWICSTARPRSTMPRRRSGSRRTGSRLPGSFVTAGTTRSGRWTSGCSSTGSDLRTRGQQAEGGRTAIGLGGGVPDHLVIR